MAHRTFNLTLPVGAGYSQLYALILATTGAVPTDGILPDRVCSLIIQSDPAGSILVSDRNFANNAGTTLASGQAASATSTRNSICLRDYYLAGSAQLVAVDLEFI